MKKYAIEIKWGVIFAVVTLLWMMLEKAFGLHDVYIEKHQTYSYLFSILATLMIVLALLDKRKNFYHGKMTWLQGFMTGLRLSIVVMILTPLTQYITSTIITPDYFNNVIEFTVDSGKMSREKAIGYFNLKNYIILSTVWAIVMGAITSAVVAIFVRKK